MGKYTFSLKRKFTTSQKYSEKLRGYKILKCILFQKLQRKLIGKMKAAEGNS